MRGLVLLAIASQLGCGPTGTFSCASRGAGGAYEECVRSKNYKHVESDYEKHARQQREKQEAEALAKKQRDERAKYDAAVEPCKRGEAGPCHVVALYGMTHEHDARAVDAAFEVACNGKIGDACFVRGQRSGGLPWYERACTFDNADGCLAAAAADKQREVPFLARACELRDFNSCEKVGLAYADRGNRAEAEKYLKLACNEKRQAACRRLGELAVQP